MLQTLFYIPDRIFGLPLEQVALALWVIVAIGLFLSSLQNKQMWSDFLGVLPILGFSVAAIFFVLPNLMEAGAGIPIRGFGAMLLLAVVTGVGMSIYRARQMGVDPEVIYSLAFWMFLAAIAGARLFYVIEYRHDFVRPTLYDSLLAMLNVPAGGIVLYGALFGGLLAAAIYFQRHRLPALALGDLIAPGMAMGGALGRIGCLLNGCCFGGLCEPPFPAVTFPPLSPPYMRQLQQNDVLGLRFRAADAGVEITEIAADSIAGRTGLQTGDVIVSIGKHEVRTPEEVLRWVVEFRSHTEFQLLDGRRIAVPFEIPLRSRPVHPAQLYDAINLALLSLALWHFYPLRRHDGEVLALMLSLYPVSRYVLEVIRIDEPSQLGTGLSISQLISLSMLPLSLVGWVWLRYRREPLALPWRNGEPHTRELETPGAT